MNFFVCSTPYHIFVSLCMMYSKNEKGIFYLTTHDKISLHLFLKVKEHLETEHLVEEVIIRKRNKVQERTMVESIRDRIEYREIKTKFKHSQIFIFPWNPYSLYTISNFLYHRAQTLSLIEDGANLYAFPKPSRWSLLIKKYLYNIETDFYNKRKVKEILVQFPEKYPDHLKEKINKLDLKKIAKELSEQKKKKIIKVFLSEKESKSFFCVDSEKSVIILTQPLSEDGYISEKEKKELYFNIVKQYKETYNVILKKHPREKTSYCFDNVIEVTGEFPSEVFSMLQLKFNKAIGVCTSAVNNIDAYEKINVDENFLKRRKENE